MLVISVIVIALLLSTGVQNALNKECVGTCKDGITVITEIKDKVPVIIVTLASGFVPYIYAPVIGFLGTLLREIDAFAFAIKGHGYIVGSLLGIVPLVLNVLCISVITAAAIYLCKTVTFSYRFSNLSHMNSLNFRIKLYEMTKNNKKQQELTKKKNKKIEALKAKKEKVNYLQLLNTTIVVILIQVISIVIQEILI